jgi:hypothetical protein
MNGNDILFKRVTTAEIIVIGLDVHKDSVFAYLLDEKEEKN